MKSECVEWGSRALIILGLIAFFAFPSEEAFSDQKFFDNTSLNHLMNYSLGLSLGARDFLMENVKCILIVLEHPLNSIEEIVRALVHIDETYFAVRTYVINTVTSHPSLSTVEQGRLHLSLLGNIFYTVGFVTVPTVSLAKAKRLSLLIEKSSKHVRAYAGTLSDRASKVFPRIDVQQSIGFAEWFAYDQP